MAEMVFALLRTNSIKRTSSAETVTEDMMAGLASGPDTKRDQPFREGALGQDKYLLFDENSGVYRCKHRKQ
jgi:hypothetical protein